MGAIQQQQQKITCLKMGDGPRVLKKLTINFVERWILTVDCFPESLSILISLCNVFHAFNLGMGNELNIMAREGKIGTDRESWEEGTPNS